MRLLQSRARCCGVIAACRWVGFLGLAALVMFLMSAATATAQTSRTVWAWGYNGMGQLGDGTTTDRHTPVQTSGLTDCMAVTAGSMHSLALKSDGTVWTWGWNYYGELGDGTTTTRHTPVQVLGLDGAGFLTGVVAVSAMQSHSLALKSDGAVWAWGYNNRGQLGDGTTTDRHTPVQVLGPGGMGFLTAVVDVSAGYYHSLALKADGTVWTWGGNSSGSLGDGTTTDRYAPVQVNGLTNCVTVAAGGSHSLALKSDGTVWAWGYNGWSELGDGTTTDRHTPVQTSGLTDCVAVGGGGVHSLAMKSDGTVWAWGGNGRGELGDGTTMQREIPVQVSSLSGCTAIAAGGAHSLALKSDGTAWGWGLNSSGQLGDGTTVNKYTPVQVIGPTDAVTVAAGSNHTLALIGAVTFHLAYGPHRGGEIMGNPEGDYPSGTGILLVASPDPGYRFVRWVINGVDAGENPVLGFQMDGNKTVEAVFGLPRTLTVVNGSGSGVYDEGTEVEIVADVPPGGVFDQWVGDVDTVADVFAATTTVVVDGDCTVTARSVTFLQVEVETEDDLGWVYQNTPLCLGNGGHKVLLSVNVLDYGENDSVEVTVAKGPGSGPGEVTVEDDPGGDPLAKYIVGSMRTDGTTNTGPLTLEVTVTGNVSEAVTVEVPFTVRRLGDIDGNGAPETADVSLIIMELNGNRPPGYHPRAFDLDANGGAEPGDVQILINILNGQPVP